MVHNYTTLESVWCLNQEHKPLSWPSLMVSRVHFLGSYSVTLPGTLVGNCIRIGTARTWTVLWYGMLVIVSGSSILYNIRPAEIYLPTIHLFIYLYKRLVSEHLIVHFVNIIGENSSLNLFHNSKEHRKYKTLCIAEDSGWQE